MNFKLYRCLPLLAVLATCSCASTKMKSTWRSPDYHGGPVSKIAVLTVYDQGTVRQVFEGHTAGALNRRGDAAIAVRDFLTLAQIKQSKEAAAAKLREAGADSVLIIRLLDASARPGKAQPGGSGFYISSSTSGWFDYYVVAFSANSMGTDLSSNTQHYYIEYSLYDLTTEKRLWSCVTQTTVKYDSDWLELVKPLTTVVLDGMAKDGLIR